MKTVLIILTLLFAISFPFAQELEYKVISKKKVIGNLTVNKTVTGARSEYIIESKFRLPFKANYSYKLVCSYEDDILISSTVETFMNRKLRSKVSTTRKGKGYEIIKDKETKYYSGDILYSEALIYFREPHNENSLFSDFSGNNKSIKSMGENKYWLHNTDNGNKSIYKYLDGYLDRAVIEWGIFEFALLKI